jgi:hypothetical protein
MNDESTTAGQGSWVVAGVLTDLSAALLTKSVGDGGLAGTLEMAYPLADAANDNRFGQLEGELG